MTTLIQTLIFKSFVFQGYRQSVWASTVQMISEHNSEYENGEHTFNLGENELADMTPDEIHLRLNGLVVSNADTSDVDVDVDVDVTVTVTEAELAKLNKTVNWIEKGYVTHVKDQGENCGSCWAFSATGSIEGAHFKSTGKLVSLSEQNLMDCSKVNKGCIKGNPVIAFKYVIAVGGIDTEASYPYNCKNCNATTADMTCKFNFSDVGATISSFKRIPANSEMVGSTFYLRLSASFL